MFLRVSECLLSQEKCLFHGTMIERTEFTILTALRKYIQIYYATLYESNILYLNYKNTIIEQISIT